MKRKSGFSSWLVPVALGLFYYLVNRYQDTQTFKSSMDFLFAPDAGLALPLFWQQNRMLLLGVLVVSILIYYRRTWKSFASSIWLFQNSRETDQRPTISPLEASYFYQQDRVMCLISWIIESCRKGVLSLNYREGLNPWSLRREPGKKTDHQDEELLAVLFQNADVVRLQASLSDPDPDVRDVADRLFRRVGKQYAHFFYPRQSSIPAWIVLFVLGAEIPFYMASLSENVPATLPVTLFSAAISAFPAYVFFRNLPELLNGPRVIASVLLVFSLGFFFFGQDLLFSSSGTAGYWAVAFYPNIVTAILVMCYQVPLLPKAPALLMQVIGYRKHLSRQGYKVMEEDLPWTLGLGVFENALDSSVPYAGQEPPNWIEKEGDDECLILLEELHQSFPAGVNHAVNGEMKGS